MMPLAVVRVILQREALAYSVIFDLPNFISILLSLGCGGKKKCIDLGEKKGGKRVFVRKKEVKKDLIPC